MPIITSDVLVDGVKYRQVDTGTDKVWEKCEYDAAGGERWLMAAIGMLSITGTMRARLLNLPCMRGGRSLHRPRENMTWLPEEVDIVLLLYHSYLSGFAACNASKDDLEVMAVARFLGRADAAPKMQLCNFGACDPEEKRHGRRRLSNRWNDRPCPRADRNKEAWDKYAANPGAFAATLPEMIRKFRENCGYSFCDR